MKAVELFAGLGGFAAGAKPAGVKIVWAANHWQEACDAYQANHTLKPSCQDLQQANFHEVPDHDILTGSSCCHGHSDARGKEQPHHDTSRSTAWAFVACAEARSPSVIVFENVTKFLKWILYPAWKLALERLGYCLAIHIIDSADHGVPQNRVRLFIIATRSKKPFDLRPVRRAHVSAESILDADGNFSPVRSLCPNSRSRIANGRRQHGDRFLVSYYGNGSGLGGRSLQRPLPTVTTRDRFALIDGNRSRMLTVDEYRKAMGFPADYILPANKKLAKHLLGNAVCPPVVTDILLDLKARL